MISLVSQTDEEFNCGQCCVAMLLNISKEEAIELVGRPGRTRSRMLRNALAKKGTILEQFVKFKKGQDYRHLPETAILKLQVLCKITHEYINHWVLYHKGEIYCPNLGKYWNVDWESMSDKNSRKYITSYFEVKSSEPHLQ